MLPLFFNAAYNLLTYWILIFIMQYVCSAHIKLNKQNILISTALSTFVLLCFKEYSDICVPLLIAITVLLFSNRKLKDLLLFFPAIVFYLIITVIPTSMVDVLLPEARTHVFIGEFSFHIVGCVIDIILLALLILLRHVLLKYETTVHLTTNEIIACVGVFFFCMLDGGLLLATNYSNMKTSYQYIWKTIYIGAFIFCVGAFLFSLIDARVRIYRRALSRSETEYLRAQLDSLQDIKENETQVKQLRHDLSNHLAIIQSLCDNGNYDDIRNYTEHLRNDIILTGSDVLTGNQVADLVVRSKLKVAREHGIDFTFHGSLSNLQSMDAPDICGLLANAYDNAIEACLPQETPYIHTKVSATRNYTVIQITNSIAHKISVRGNHISTTKKDKGSHGYGIDIMKRIAHKYNGNCTLYCSDKEFSVKIVLLVNPSNE